MGFDQKEAEQLLVACHRRCCICHRFCGVKIELHHIRPKEDGGDDSVENAIPLCFECHAEVGHYNPKHPRGRKFYPRELQTHKDEWLRICQEEPGALLAPQLSHDVGPIQALIDELEFNAEIAKRTDSGTIGALFLVAQFERSIREGVFSLLSDAVRNPIAAAYATLMRANSCLQNMAAMPRGSSAWRDSFAEAGRSMTLAQSEVSAAYGTLLEHLGHSEG